jgi:hypothetical protein
MERSFWMSKRFRSDITEGQGSGENTLGPVSVEDIRNEWRLLWRKYIDDKLRAEGVANQDYSMLFVDRGTVIVATKDFKPLNFKEILRLHREQFGKRFTIPHPSEGGYTKFARNVLNKQKRNRESVSHKSVDNSKKSKILPKKKGGRGWLHYSMTK